MLGDQFVLTTGPPLSSCRAPKAAASYVRSHALLPYVFPLTGSSPEYPFASYFGAIGDFYYGLSYGRSVLPEDPTHLLDFGAEQFGRRYPPQAYYRPYGVPHFDYYIDFVDDHDEFKAPVISQLFLDGARLVCMITDNSRPIGRIFSFRNDPPIQLEYRAAAEFWDHHYGRIGMLLQPMAGTAYHFCYSWRRPE